jgi:RNA polymerase sigma-70 factor, ECF subfamily
VSLPLHRIPRIGRRWRRATREDRERNLAEAPNTGTGHTGPLGGSPLEPRKLYEEQFAFVYNCLRRLGASNQDLPDLAQEVFLRAFQHVDAYDRLRPIRPWLFGFAFRAILDFRRADRRYRATEPSAFSDMKDLGPSPEENARENELRASVLRALDRLDLPQRALLVSHDVEGWTVPEISQALSIPLNTVYTRLRRARQAFIAVARGDSGLAHLEVLDGD